MNNKNFIIELSQRTHFSQDDVQRMVFTLIDAMNEKFLEGESVTFSRFGTFEVKKRLERVIVNPSTQQRMLVPPKLVLTFKPIASIKEKLKNGGTENG
ncbi:MAG: HU family DNA-binding protein [Prevotella sp.]|nr:HU family DNA-binding protein [Prevotella sp.]MBR1462840.1 HU family DNA-binding protein [Prevotella sp.]